MTRTSCWSLLTLGWIAATATAQDHKAFVIHGRVVDGTAKAVPGAMVRLLAPGGLDRFEVDQKATTAADGRFRLAASKSWTRMDATHRQELALVAVKGKRVSVVQFYRSSAVPKAAVELPLAETGGSDITILAPDLRPVVGAKVKLIGLTCDTIHAGLTDAEARQYGGKARKTPLGHAIGTGTVILPPDMEMEVGLTDANGLVTVANIAAAKIGAVTIQTDDFGEQTVGFFAFLRAKTTNWTRRIVLKKTGRLVGQVSAAGAGAVAQREVTLSSFEQNPTTGIFYSSGAKIITDREGKFAAAKMIPGGVRFAVRFDAGHPARPQPSTSALQLKAGETLHLKIDLKPAVKVRGRVLDASTKKPIPDVQVRAFLGMDFEAATSDAEGRFAFWMPAGETAFHPDIPEEYLPLLRPSDYLDPAKRQQELTIFKVPDVKTFEAPPIYLLRPAKLRGTVVDDRGRPLPGTRISGIAMSLDQRTGQPKPLEVTAHVDERGEFVTPALDPREPIRLRVTAKAGAKIVTVAKPGSEALRIVIDPQEQFRIFGTVADAEGSPIAEAVLEIWQRDWRPAPPEAEARQLALKEPVRADAQGRFKTPPLSPDGFYRFTIRAAGAKTTETAWLDATQPETGKPQRFVVTRMGGSAGVVRDTTGKPVAGARVWLYSNETRTETVSNARGEFKLDIPAGKPFCVIVRHPDFRTEGSLYEKNPPNLNQTLARLSERREPLARRSVLSKQEREKLLKRLLEPVKQNLVKSTSTQEKVQSLQSLTGAVPDFVTEFLEKHPLQPALYNEMLLTQVAMKRVSRNQEEAEEFIGRLQQGAQKSMAYGLLADALPENMRARKLEILAEALVGARAEKSPEFRAISLGQVAKRLYGLGEKDRAASLLREGEKIAGGLATSGFAGYARGSFATDLALIDLPAALALMKNLKDPHEFARHHGNTAHRIAATHPAEAVGVLELIPPPGPNEFNQRDQYAIRVCYRMAKADSKAALQLAGSIVDSPSRAYALGVIAQAVAKNNPTQAPALIRRAFAILEEDAARPDPPQLTGPLLPGAVAAGLVLSAEQIDPALVRACLWRSVALGRAPTEDPQQVWRYTAGNSALAMVAARYDGELAGFLLPARKTDWVSREWQLASFLTDPHRAVETAEKAPQAKGDRQLLQLIGYLAAGEDDVPRLILNTLGLWRIDVEDIDL